MNVAFYLHDLRLFKFYFQFLLEFGLRSIHGLVDLAIGMDVMQYLIRVENCNLGTRGTSQDVRLVVAPVLVQGYTLRLQLLAILNISDIHHDVRELPIFDHERLVELGGFVTAPLVLGYLKLSRLRGRTLEKNGAGDRSPGSNCTPINTQG